MNGDSRVFVDTNVLIYAYDNSAGDKHERARALCEQLWKERRGALSVQVLQEFYVTVTVKGSKPLSMQDARRVVVNLSRWPTHEPRATDVLEAIDIGRDNKIAFWDAMIVRSASDLGCDVLLTEDLNPGQTYRGVRVEDPFS